MKAGIDYIGVGVGALVIRRNNEYDEILFLRRLTSAPGTGSWTIPGGEMEFGEIPEFAIARELFEEACIKPKMSSLIDVINFIESGQHWISFVFLVNQYEGTPQIGEREQFDEIKWFRIDDLPLLNPVSSITVMKNLSRLQERNE